MEWKRKIEIEIANKVCDLQQNNHEYYGFNINKVCELQQNNHEYYGFNINKKLYWNWNAEGGTFDDETLQGYIESYPNFFEDFKINLL
jgi:hypothetical protein